MKPLQALVLGAVQGLTEFLPVSSTAHINLTARILGWRSPGVVLDTSLHLGTLVATLAWLLEEEVHEPLLTLPLVVKVSLATLPAGLAGLFLENWIDQRLRSPNVTSMMLIVGAGLLWLAEKQARQTLTLSKLDLSRAMLIGMAQMLALIPGLSRSGATMSAGLLVGLTRKDAVRFSYLLGAPIVAASGLFKLRSILKHEDGRELLHSLLIGGLTAAVTGFMSLEWMLGYVRKHSLVPFAIHRMVTGLLISRAQRQNRRHVLGGFLR